VHLLKPARLDVLPGHPDVVCADDGQRLAGQGWLQYPFRKSHPIIRWLPSKLAAWICEKFGQELQWLAGFDLAVAFFQFKRSDIRAVRRCFELFSAPLNLYKQNFCTLALAFLCTCTVYGSSLVGASVRCQVLEPLSGSAQRSSAFARQISTPLISLRSNGWSCRNFFQCASACGFELQPPGCDHCALILRCCIQERQVRFGRGGSSRPPLRPLVVARSC
jgi:hypothetical protein